MRSNTTLRIFFYLPTWWFFFICWKLSKSFLSLICLFYSTFVFILYFSSSLIIFSPLNIRISRFSRCLIFVLLSFNLSLLSILQNIDCVVSFQIHNGFLSEATSLFWLFRFLVMLSCYFHFSVLFTKLRELVLKCLYDLSIILRHNSRLRFADCSYKR